MIAVVEGKGVGSGKSYFAVRYAIRHWCDGGTVYASESLRFKWPEIKSLVLRRYGWKLQDDQYHSVKAGEITDLHEHTSAGSDDLCVLIIVDEAQDQLNARDWSDKSKRELFAWACQSRHDNNDLLFVTQAAANIDKQIRRLATFYYSVRNLEKFPLAGLGKIGSLVRLFSLGFHHGILFVQAQIDSDGRTVLERKLVSGDRGFFNCYDSKSMRAARKRLGVIERKKLERAREHKPMTKWILIVALVMLGFGVHHIWKHGIIPKPEMKHDIADSGKGSLGGAAAAVRTMDGVTTVKPEAAYLVREEKVRYRLGNGDHEIKLESGWYHEGELCKDGMVERVRNSIIRVKTPEGKLLYIVGVM